MNIEDIKNRLEELETEKAENVRKVKKFKKETREKIAELSEKIDTTPDPMEAVRLNKERSDLREGLELFEKKDRTSKPIMTMSENNAIRSALNAEIEETKVKHREAILEALEAFEAVMNEYANEAEGLEALKERAWKLSSNAVLSGGDYKAEALEAFDEYHAGASNFFYAYFNNRRNAILASKRW